LQNLISKEIKRPKVIQRSVKVYPVTLK